MEEKGRTGRMEENWKKHEENGRQIKITGKKMEKWKKK